MELKQAMETATETLDVRPGFVGDVMTGARRRHTRKLLTVTAVVALLAGLVTGVVLTGSNPAPSADDPRLTAATSGDLAADTEFLTRSLDVWRDAQTVSALARNAVTDVSARPKVFWAARTPGGPAALVVQPVEAHNSEDARTMVGLVVGDAVVDSEVVQAGGQERGIYQFGPDDSTFVVLGLGRSVYWSVNPTRGPDQRWSRSWQRAETGMTGVAVLTAKRTEKPVFLRTTSEPGSKDFFALQQERIVSAKELQLGEVLTQHPGVLGWPDVMWATRLQEPDLPGTGQDRSVVTDLQKRGYLDFGSGSGALTGWEVRAWLPDGRFATVFEASEELVAAIYHADGRFDRLLPGGPVQRDLTVPVRITLPDAQGVILAERGALLGPEERRDAWLAPPGITQVTLWQHGNTTEVPL
ncbi:hypothetical protein BBK82_20715 [Lentzea guizhouensis]|uniref:Uncharacterized protein n=1 Tax=Lentzea guizhouensis TaxID=1586287 RepID=A0A1B2HK98_9PSEU|nr:hypothetical protein [Lentzea guizhouensis]ANZ38122.1 hypothetical protein BBK82_20715 [Lentzea guizhouensis]